ncbi:MAG: macro domain-containing protein, partial [Bacteroidota bacterium]
AQSVRCPTGEARITDGFALPAKHVIHAVGPVWRGGDDGERDLLASAYRNSLALAAERGLATVAFPAISTGAFGFPAHEAARIAVETIAAFLAAHGMPERVVLVAFDAKNEKAWRQALQRSAGV